MVWNTQKNKSLFNNKDKVNDYTCVVYREEYVHSGQVVQKKVFVMLDYNGMSMKMVQIRIRDVLNI